MDQLLNTYSRQIAPNLTLTVQSLDLNCSTICVILSKQQDSNSKPKIYSEQFSCASINSSLRNSKKSQQIGSSSSPKILSMLFLKLALENLFSKLSSSQQANPNTLIAVSDLIWEKAIVGHDKIQAALSAMSKNNHKNTQRKYPGYVIRLSFPQEIALVLPQVYETEELMKKISNSPNKQAIKAKQQQNKSIQRLLFTAE